MIMPRINADVTQVDEKGRVTIPYAIRKKLGIKPNTKLLVYGHSDVVIMKKVVIPDVNKDLKMLYNRVDTKVRKYGGLPAEDIEQIITESRGKKISNMDA